MKSSAFNRIELIDLKNGFSVGSRSRVSITLLIARFTTAMIRRPTKKTTIAKASFGA